MARLGVVAGGALALIVVPLTSALAQMPAAAAVPSAMPTGVPSAVPSALPSASPNPPPMGGPPPGDDAPPPPRKPVELRQSDVVLLDATSNESDSGGGQAKLPKELQGQQKARRPPLDEEEQDKQGLAYDTPIVSASTRKEGIRSALGSVMVLTKKDLLARGYTDLSQILDDLPGTDVVRPWGDVYVRSYFRGNRTVGADPYSLLVDGVEMNQLYTRNAQILASLPLSNVARVEVVFSPLSSVYGPNAAMGVINVITESGRDRQEAGYYGVSLDARVSFGGPQNNFNRLSDLSKIVDASAWYITRDYRLRLTARLESSVFDRGAGDGFGSTVGSTYGNGATWGNGTFSAYPYLAGTLPSPDRKGAVDARIYIGRGTEIGAQFFTLSTGYGVEYPAQQRQATGLYTGREWSAYARHVAEITPGLKSTTLIQFRESDIAYTSLTNDGANVTLRNVESPSTGALVREDVEISTRRGLALKDDQLTIGTGFRYQYLSLPGGNTGEYVTSSSFWPVGANPGTQGTDVVTSPPLPGKAFDEIGGYVNARWSLTKNQHVAADVRVDKPATRNDADLSARVGWSGTFADLITVKAWYGHSIFDPSWQQDLAATVAPAVAPTLSVSQLDTVEADVDLWLKFLAVHVDGYFTYESNPVVSFKPGDATSGPFINMGSRKLLGIDAGVRLLLKPVNFWVYYTHNFHFDDTYPDGGIPAGTAASQGDIASDKIWVGATVAVGPFTGTLLNRWMIGYDVVPTNALPTTPPSFYTTLDANLKLDIIDNLWFAFKVTNIIGTNYTHPGIQTADCATTTCTGSYNAQLAQPGRGFYGTLGYRFDQEKALHPK